MGTSLKKKKKIKNQYKDTLKHFRTVVLKTCRALTEAEVDLVRDGSASMGLGFQAEAGKPLVTASNWGSACMCCTWGSQIRFLCFFSLKWKPEESSSVNNSISFWVITKKHMIHYKQLFIRIITDAFLWSEMNAGRNLDSTVLIQYAKRYKTDHVTAFRVEECRWGDGV